MNNDEHNLRSIRFAQVINEAVEQQVLAKNKKLEAVAAKVTNKSGSKIKVHKNRVQPSPQEEMVKERVPLERIEMYLKNKYEFRRNVVSGFPEYRHIGEEKFEQITDNILNTLWRELLIAKRTCTPSYLANLLNSDFATAYDPFVEYLSVLPEWDRETDYIRHLAETVTTSNKEFFIFCLRKWLVAMVGCWIEPKVINQSVIVFSGAQGIGKTTWIDNLVPSNLRSYYYSGTINPHDKDTMVHLSECALINMDELENLNRTEIGTLKEIITKGQIRLRRAYRKSPEVLPRRASFAGSVNLAQFLNDPTGSRRFLCFEALEFDLEGRVDMNHVYSQALALFKSGFQYWFNKEETKLLERNNEQYQKMPLEEEMLLQLFVSCKLDEEGCIFLTATEIANAFEREFRIRIDNGLVNRIGKAATRLSFIKVKRQGVYKYCLKRKQIDTIDEVLLDVDER